MATLGSLDVGSIVKLNVNGTAWNWIVVHQGLPGSMYDASCDGTWLLMEDLYERRVWDSSNHDYENSDIHSYLNNTFVKLFDSDIKSAIKQVKIPYRAGSGTSTTVTSGSSGLSAKVFLLSYTEIGFAGSSHAPVEGYVLDYFYNAENSKRVAKTNGYGEKWYLRSPYTNDRRMAWRVLSNGSNSYYDVRFDDSYVRPALVLPYDTSIGGGAITGSVNIGGVERELTGGGYINIGGVLRELSDSNVNIGGTIESLKG